MGSEDRSLSILFFPFMAQGHMLPMLDMAKLFALYGVKSIVVTTPANVPIVNSVIDQPDVSTLHPIQLRLIPFPSDTGLPEGCENVSSIPPRDMPTVHVTFFSATAKLREPFGKVLEDLRPDCIVTDMFFPWTYDVAAELGIPRIVFHGTNFFSLCVTDSLERYKPVENLRSDAESVIIPGLPHRIEVLRSQIPEYEKSKADFVREVTESESKSYGAVVNSFFELEPDYARHYREVVGRRAWHIGPLALANDSTTDKSSRGYKTAIDRNDCLKWLDSKSLRSVVYVCFGSMSDFSDAQLREMASGLEASNHPFIWVVRKSGKEWLPEGFEERVQERGLIIRGWAPQILILNHRAVGGFMTHCGWNSSLEAVSAGLPLVTWPLFAEQFYNERFIVDVLRIGVSVGAKRHGMSAEEREVVEAEMVKKAVDGVMGDGEEAEGRRRRARELGEKARKAVEKGGSSYEDMRNLVEELKSDSKLTVGC
uniref:Glycosyltransferase n=1 Tax=Crocus sativus TaxID=82528 RepID=A0A139YZN6_CROSA|nr:UDP-glucose-dependent flavonoid glucosyltransferase UGT703B1 [Crocus sativus]